MKNDLKKVPQWKIRMSVPRLVLGFTAALTALTLWACGATDFGTKPPQPPERKPKPLTTDPAEPPAKVEDPKQSEPQDPKRVISLKITGLQPEAWWNNCLKIEMGGKTFDIACTKDKEVKDKIVRIPIPEDITCPVLDLRVETFKNVGETCNERAKQGLACEGPFESSPSVVRKYSVAADRVHFVLSEGVSSGSGRVIRAFFEDQDAETIGNVKNDPARAEALGIDFNDAIFELSTPELPFEISGAAGTKCKSTQ